MYEVQECVICGLNGIRELLCSRSPLATLGIGDGPWTASRVWEGGGGEGRGRGVEERGGEGSGGEGRRGEERREGSGGEWRRGEERGGEERKVRTL